MSEIRDAHGLTEAEFLSQYDSSIYAKPSVTADIIVFRTDVAFNNCKAGDGCEAGAGAKAGGGAAAPEVLLIRRKGHPFLGHWALPGGFAEPGETVGQTAARELEEETGVTGLSMELTGIYSKPGRDPRGWTITAAYMAVVGRDQIRPKAGDDAGAVCWAEVSLSDGALLVTVGGEDITGELAFDHDEIIRDAIERFHMKVIV